MTGCKTESQLSGFSFGHYATGPSWRHASLSRERAEVNEADTVDLPQCGESQGISTLDEGKADLVESVQRMPRSLCVCKLNRQRG